MSTARARENTFKVDLSNFPKRPSFEEIHSFVHQTLGLSIDQVLRLQMNHAQNCAHVKCKDLKTAQDAVDQNNGRHEMEVNRTKIKVRLMMDDGGVEVKIHDLSENIRNEDIAAFLGQYGEVISIKELIWGDNFAFKGVSSGVRVAKMILHRHIKSFVTILGEETLVSYRNQPQYCKHCTNPSHPGLTCVENKKLIGQKTDLNNRLKAAQKKTSYASVLDQSVVAASLLPEFVGTNLNQLNANARSSSAPSNSAVEEKGARGVPSPSAAADDDERMDEGGEPKITSDAATTATAVAADAVVAVVAAAAPALPPATSTVATATPVPDTTIVAATSAAAEDIISGEESNATAGRSTQQAEVVVQPCNVSGFKIPFTTKTIPSNSLLMQISDSDTNESSTEGGPFLKVKRPRGRPKKQKLVDSQS